MNTTFLEALRNTLPPTFSRQVAAESLKGIYSVGALANLDAKGKGPGDTRFGRCVAYERETFLQWLARRIEEADKRNVRKVGEKAGR